MERLILRQKSSKRLILKRKKFGMAHYKTTDKYLEREQIVSKWTMDTNLLGKHIDKGRKENR